MENEQVAQQIKHFVGRKIEEFRLAKGFSQVQLAELIGKDSANTISYFEAGLRKVSIDDLIKIAKVLERTVNDFLPKIATEHLEPKEFAIKLRANYDKLDKETEKSILDFTELAKKRFGKK